VAAFFRSVDQLKQLNWDAIDATQWNDPMIKEAKQAEFLVQEYFPWRLFEQIGVCDENIASEVRQTIKNAGHQPTVSVKRDWYY
jgi:hypothetical protein